MKANAIVRIVIYSLLIAMLLCIMVGVIGYKLYFQNGRLRWNDTPVPTEAAMEINQLLFPTQVQNIDIDWVAGSISIHPSDSLDNILVEEYGPAGSEYTMVCRQSGQTLKIEFCEEKEAQKLIGINRDVSKHLVIRVPKNWNCNTLEIDAAATDVTVQDLTIRELDFDGASGKFFLDNCNISDLDIDTASGDVEFVGTLEHLDLDGASAQFYGEFYNKPKNIKMDTMSGDLELVLPEDCGFELDMNAVSGNFETDFSVGKYDKTLICGEGDCKIKVNAMSGNVSILKGMTAGKNCDH